MNSTQRGWFFGLILLSAAFGISSVPAATVVLTPVADTSLMENWPGNNIGGATFFITGTTQVFTKNKGLLKFDIAGNIPAGSRIDSVKLTLEVTHQPVDGYDFASFGLHRALKAWGEGNQVSPTNCTSCAGVGAAAATNEASWLSPMAFTTNAWSQPGAASPTDFAGAASSVQYIYQEGVAYDFETTPELVADVQAWLNSPAANLGWVLVCQSEELNFTARRFGSREDPNKAPLLEINYTPPLRIDLAETTNGQFNLYFQAEAGQNYTVQYTGSLVATNNWSTLTNIPAQPATTTLIVTDPLTPTQRVYRLVAP